MGSATIRIPHTAKHVTDDGEIGGINLVPGGHRPFMAVMDYLYPQLISASDERNIDSGYMGFDGEGQFIGLCFGRTMAAIRKNPWHSGDRDAFLKFQLAVLAHEKITAQVSITRPHNYGTLRLWNRLGFGAELWGEKVRAAEGTDEGAIATMVSLLASSKRPYSDIRAAAAKRKMSIAAEKVLPRIDNYASLIRYRVELHDGA